MPSQARSQPQPRLSVVVPTRNEAANVDALWGRLSAALADTDFEICFVDDSDDDTPTRLAKLEAENPDRVRCRFREGEARQGGLATAVVDGLHVAHGRFVCVMDADLQHPPETIPRLLAAAEQGADLAVASRYIGGGSGGGLDGVLRRAISRVSCGVARALFSEARRSSDPLSGYFLCRRALLDGIEFRPVGFKILLELLVCVPTLKVVDVPLEFAPRFGGESKATLGQGLLFLRHLASLFFDVQGSARAWKFALVGISGLAIFLPLLALFVHTMGASSLAAFWLAYLPSVAWNTAFNRYWTFADVRRRLGRREAQLYLMRAVAAGVVTFAAYAWLLRSTFDPVIDGLLAALLAMLINGLSNYRSAHRRPVLWSELSADANVTAALQKLAERVGADRAYLLPPRRTASTSGIPGDLIERVIALRHGATWTEAPSHRPQRRNNIDLAATMLLPVVNAGDVVGVVILERQSPRGFPAEALESAMRGVESLAPLLLDAASAAAPALRSDPKPAPQA